ncbi:MAG: hypothetical protein AB7I08_07680 [Thermoleophilia bacterium]
MIAAVLVVAGVLTLLAMGDSGQGAAAIDQVEEAVAPGLRDAGRRVETQGGTLRVSWSSTPSPGGGGHIVMARLAVEPSGGVGTASFGVSGDRVVAQNQLARSLLESSDQP